MSKENSNNNDNQDKQVNITTKDTEVQEHSMEIPPMTRPKEQTQDKKD